MDKNSDSKSIVSTANDVPTNSLGDLVSKPRPILKDILFAPFNLEIINAHLTLRSLQQTPTVRLDPATPEVEKRFVDQLAAWLLTRDDSQLALILRKYPRTIVHPSIYKQIFHLSDLLRKVDEDDFRDGLSPAMPKGQSEVLPWGTKDAARASLHQLLNAWVQGILSDFEVVPIKHAKRRGRRAGMDFPHNWHFLHDFNDLFEVLQEIEDANPTSLYQRKEEIQSTFVKRMIDIVEVLHRRSCYHYAEGDHWPLKKLPLSKGIAEKIAKQAMAKKGMSKNKLIFGLLAFYLHKNHTKWRQVSKIVERLEEEFPKDDIRR